MIVVGNVVIQISETKKLTKQILCYLPAYKLGTVCRNMI